MSIIKDTLHPSGYNDIDLYPKTSADQVEGLNERIAEIVPEFISGDINCPYPIGGICFMDNENSPSAYFANTAWEKIEDVFLLGSGSNHMLGDTGGSENAVVVLHGHSIYEYVSSDDFVESQISRGRSIVHVNDSSHNIYFSAGNAMPKTANNFLAAGTNNEGESGVGKNMPPYKTVNIWKRIA